ncbi:c-type cytochrome [uncultured Paenalcaligenes sp.]|uniref:c-type cytochrome n=1 Tax=uncultured Paenalcaligenes sp. TaxID=1588925 RepID=UPI0026330216|nr:c-type cytochrome [uncultured Paenalcaligenes sp.]
MKRVLSKFIITSSLIAGCSVLNFAYAADAAKPDLQKGEQLYLNGNLAKGVLACVTCHGDAGNSTLEANPNLAQQPFEYLVKQLGDFSPKKDDVPATRLAAGGVPAVMASIVANMTPEEMRDVAYYLSQQTLDPTKAATATKMETLERGQKIWRGGLPERGVAACAACHSPNGAGLPGQYPRLSGQFPSYIAEQLRLFRSGDRNNQIMMHDIADRMNDADIDAVADYAAGLR